MISPWWKWIWTTNLGIKTSRCTSRRLQKNKCMSRCVFVCVCVWLPVAACGFKEEGGYGSLDNSPSWEAWPCRVTQAKQHAKYTAQRDNSPATDLHAMPSHLFSSLSFSPTIISTFLSFSLPKHFPSSSLIFLLLSFTSPVFLSSYPAHLFPPSPPLLKDTSCRRPSLA